MSDYRPEPTGWRALASGAIGAGLVILGLVAVMWVLEIFDFVLGGALDQFGIRAWDPEGLVGIFFAPFLHVGFAHLMANSVPLIILGFLAALRGIGRFLWASLIIIVVGGLGAWLTTAPGVTVLGASGLVFGYFGYVMARGVFDRRALDIVIGIGVAVAYYSLLWGLLPNQEGISWQGHLFGLVGGVVAAWVLRRKRVTSVDGRALGGGV